MSENETVVEEIEVQSEVVVAPKEPKTVAKLEEEGDIAADYLEALLDIADLDGDIDIDVENGRQEMARINQAVGFLEISWLYMKVDILLKHRLPYSMSRRLTSSNGQQGNRDICKQQLHRQRV